MSNVYHMLSEHISRDVALLSMTPYDLLTAPLSPKETLVVLKNNNIPIQEYLESGDLFHTVFMYAPDDTVDNAVQANDIITLDRMKRYHQGSYKGFIEFLIFLSIVNNDSYDRLELLPEMPKVEYLDNSEVKISDKMMKVLTERFPKNESLVRYIVSKGDMSLLQTYLKGGWYPDENLLSYIQYVKPRFMERYYSLLHILDDRDIRVLLTSLFSNPDPEVIIFVLKKLRSDFGLQNLPNDLKRQLFLPAEALHFLIYTRMIRPGDFKIFIKGPLTEELLDSMVKYGFKTSYKALYYKHPDNAEFLRRLYEKGLVEEADIDAYNKQVSL